MESCDRFLEFVKRSNAVSPTIALETATVLQVMMSIFLSKCLILH
jgi:vacuolar protein sorting-associated protein 13A/C